MNIHKTLFRVTNWAGILTATMVFGVTGLRSTATGAEGGAAAAPGGVAAPFSASSQCLACHNGMTGADGRDLSIGAQWRGSVMGHAARDPYWQAGVRREVTDFPEHQTAIEAECSICHMPMDRILRRQAGGQGVIFANLAQGIADMNAPNGPLAADGVSCTVCHQILPDGLGQRSSFVGNFAIDTTTPAGARKAFGPFEVALGQTRIMQSASGFVPQASDVIRKSEMCASCHTLYTHTLAKGAEGARPFPEQVPYLEWKHSDYAGSQDCQDCHMKVVPHPAPIASVMAPLRDKTAQHLFRGGNFFLLGLLSRHRAELTLDATTGELATTRQATMDRLATESAHLSIDAGTASLSGGQCGFTVRIENLAGHKLPTAYPSRRVWLHVTVTDAGGNTLFESGALQPDGSIRGNDNDADPSTYEPHYEQVTQEGQVAIYEAILGTVDGRVTTGLLEASRYLKDNRILPSGFDKAGAELDIAVAGEALADANFLGGGDQIRYQVAVPEGLDRAFVTVQLRYQPIGYRWAMNLKGVEAFEPQRFVTMYQATPGEQTAVTLAQVRAEIR